MIHVYSKANCPGCVSLKNKLKAKQVPFLEVRIDLDPEAKQFLIDKGIRSVPAMFRNGQPYELDL